MTRFTFLDQGHIDLVLMTSGWSVIFVGRISALH